MSVPHLALNLTRMKVFIVLCLALAFVCAKQQKTVGLPEFRQLGTNDLVPFNISSYNANTWEITAQNFVRIHVDNRFANYTVVNLRNGELLLQTEESALHAGYCTFLKILSNSYKPI